MVKMPEMLHIQLLTLNATALLPDVRRRLCLAGSYPMKLGYDFVAAKSEGRR